MEQRGYRLIIKNRFKVFFVLMLLICFHWLNIAEKVNSASIASGKAWSTHYGRNIQFIERFELDPNIYTLCKSNSENPPVFYIVSLGLFKIFNSYKAIFYASGVFFIVLILSVYGIGGKLYDEEAGVFAAVLCSFFPYIYKSATHFNLELATVAMTALSIYFLLDENVFLKPVKAIVLGGGIGLGMLTRSFFPFFIIGPFIFIVVRSYKHKTLSPHSNTLKITAMMCLASFIALLIGYLFYYQPAFYNIALDKSGIMGVVSDPRLIYKTDILYYIKALPLQLGWTGTMALMLSLVFLLRKNNRDKLFLLSWIIIPLVPFSFILKKDIEYTMAYLPAIALLISIGLNEFADKKVRSLIMVSVVIVYICFYYLEFWKELRIN